MIMGFHVPDDGLPTISYVDMLHPDGLVAAATQAPKCLDLN
jgi:hypothetical protein